MNNTIPLTVCPNCNLVPSLKVIDNDADKIYIHCPCSYDKTIPIQEYVQIIEKKASETPNCEFCSEVSEKYCAQCNKYICKNHLPEHKDHPTTVMKININNHCSVHNDKLVEFYCFDCKLDFCSECAKTHDQHRHLRFQDYMNKEKIAKISQEASNSLQSFINFGESIKNEIIKNLQEQIKRINDAYENNVKINNAIISFVKSLISTYSSVSPNYTLLNNLIAHSSFKTQRPNIIPVASMTNINNLVTYYNSNFFLDKPNFELKNIPKIVNSSVTEVTPDGSTPDGSTPDGSKRRSLAGSSEFTDLTRIKEEKKVAFKFSVRGVALLENNLLAVCCDDCTVRLLSVPSLEQVSFKTIHSWGITSIIAITGGKLATSSSDNSIEILKINGKSIEIEQTLTGHYDKVYKVIQLTKERLASCSANGIIKIWGLDNQYEEIKTLLGHKGGVVSLLQLSKGETMVSLSYDKTVIFWSLETYSFDEKNVISGVNTSSINNNSICEISHNKIAIGSEQSIIIINVERFVIEKEIKDKYITHIDSFLLMDDQDLLCGCRNGSLYHLNTNEYKGMSKKDNAHKGIVLSLTKLSDNSFVSTSTDGSVKLWTC